MTTKHLTGAYPDGYALKARFTKLDIEATATVGGTGVTASAPATITNFGAVQSGGDGIYLHSGGAVTNGSVTNTSAQIEGGRTGILVYGRSATIANFGTIQANATGYGIHLYSGGTVTNGSASDTTALIGAQYGVDANTRPATVVNFGSILGRLGVFLIAGGEVSNGSASDTTALIKGSDNPGIFAIYAAVEIANFGTIQSTFSDGVRLGQGGVVTNGSTSDTTALIDGGLHGVTSGASIAIANFGTIHASGSGVYSKAGGTVTNGSASDTAALIEGGVGVLASGNTTVINYGTIVGPESSPAVRFTSAGGLLVVEAASVFEGAVLGGGGTLDLASGVGTISGLSDGNVTVSGSMATTAFTNFGTVEIATGATFTLAGSGAIGTVGTNVLNVDGSLIVTGALSVSGTAVLDDAGVVDQSHTVVLNRNARPPRLIVAAGATWALDGDVGFARRRSKSPEILIDGLFIKSGGTGVSSIGVVVSDAGTIEAATGTLAFLTRVQGTGLMTIDAGATLSFAAAAQSTLTAGFNGAGGTLALNRAAAFAATISGFATGDAIDLVATAATSAVLNGADQLVITNGSATVATLQLTGDYAGAAFATASDGHGGTSITVSTPPGSDPQAAPKTVHPFVAAAASFGAHSGAAWLTAQTHAERSLSPLAAPRIQTA